MNDASNNSLQYENIMELSTEEINKQLILLLNDKIKTFYNLGR